MTTTLMASSTAQLNADIDEVNAAASGSFIIELTAGITQNANLDAIDLQSGVTLTLDGGNFTLNGAGTYTGLIVDAGGTGSAVTIDDLELNNSTSTLATGTLVGTVTIASNATLDQTGQLTFGTSDDPATVINQGTWDIQDIVGITDGTGSQSSLFEDEGLLELTSFEQGNGSGVSKIYVNTTVTGTLSVPDDGSAPGASGSNIRFFGASNSFPGTAAAPVVYQTYMVDYGAGVNNVGYVDMQDGACSTNFDGSRVDQSGIITLSDDSSINNSPGATWNFTSDNGMIEEPGQPNYNQPVFSNSGTLAKIGGSGTTDVAIDFGLYGTGGFIIVDTGTLAFDAPDTLSYITPNNVFSDQAISGAGIFSLGGGGDDAINSGTTITSSGWTVTDAGTNVTLNESLTYSGTFTDQSGANLTLTGDVTLTLASLAGSGGSITFDLDSELKFAGQSLSQFAATIDGFAPGNVIDLTSIANVAGSHANMNYTSNVLTITEGSNTYTLEFNPDQSFVGDYFHLASDNGGDGPGTDITENTMPCYCRGTLISTEGGEVPVEALTIGSKVLTKSGKARPIKWIGRRSYGGRFIMGRKDVLPICIKAGALDDRVPQRDLWLSPHHALYLDGMLIEAKDLVNGVSIVQADRVEKVEYFHVELETHDVIIAEGAPAESFIDDDSRGVFSNASEYRQLYGNAAVRLAQCCAPRRESGYRVEAARQRIALRAGVSAKGQPCLGGLRGFVDRVGADSIEGWAQNIQHPEAPVCLDIYSSGRRIGQVLANGYRDDLAKARLGSGRHGFVFTPPRGLIIDSDSLQVRRSLDAAALPSIRLPRTAAA